MCYYSAPLLTWGIVRWTTSLRSRADCSGKERWTWRALINWVTDAQIRLVQLAPLHWKLSVGEIARGSHEDWNWTLTNEIINYFVMYYFVQRIYTITVLNIGIASSSCRTNGLTVTLAVREGGCGVYPRSVWGGSRLLSLESLHTFLFDKALEYLFIHISRVFGL